MKEKNEIKIKQIRNCFPDLFDELKLIAGINMLQYDEEKIRVANNSIFNYCSRQCIPYRDLALLPEII